MSATHPALRENRTVGSARREGATKTRLALDRFRLGDQSLQVVIHAQVAAGQSIHTPGSHCAHKRNGLLHRRIPTLGKELLKPLLNQRRAFLYLGRCRGILAHGRAHRAGVRGEDSDTVRLGLRGQRFCEANQGCLIFHLPRMHARLSHQCFQGAISR